MVRPTDCIEIFEIIDEDNDEIRYFVSGYGIADGLYDEEEFEDEEEAKTFADEWQMECNVQVPVVWL